MDIILYQSPIPFGPALLPYINFEMAKEAVLCNLPVNFNNAPKLLTEGTKLDSNLLDCLNKDWKNPQCYLTGLVGYGRDQRSQIARLWVDNLLKSQSKPTGVFWWTFSNKSNINEFSDEYDEYVDEYVNEFFESALIYLGGKEFNLNELSSACKRAEFLAGMLRGGQYLFVIDGLETVQYQEGDNYGRVANDALRKFLHYFAAGDHKSFCLITSRIPVLDLINYITYNHYFFDARNFQSKVIRENKKAVVSIFRDESRLKRVIQQILDQDLANEDVRVTGIDFSIKKGFISLIFQVVNNPFTRKKFSIGSFIGAVLGIVIPASFLLYNIHLGVDFGIHTLQIFLSVLAIWGFVGLIIGGLIGLRLKYLLLTEGKFKPNDPKLATTEIARYLTRIESGDFLLTVIIPASRRDEFVRLLRDAGGNQIRTVDTNSLASLSQSVSRSDFITV